MGYGLLTLGYVIAFFMSLTSYGDIICLFGYGLIAYALYKLRDYFPSYILSFFAILALGVNGLVKAGCFVAELIAGDLAVADQITAVTDYVGFALTFIFHILFLIATYIALGAVGLNDKRVSAVTDICAVVVGHVFYILVVVADFAPSAAIFTELVWRIMVFVLIFSCYMRICPEGDEDMPRKRSRFAFINKIGDELDRREQIAIERTQREIEEKKKARDGAKKKRKKRK